MAPYVTVGGSRAEVEKYMQECRSHWSFAGLALDSEEEVKEFFKPTEGCACVFSPSPSTESPAHGPSISIRITAEITPMGITGYTPPSWSSIEVLAPEEFHRRLTEERVLLVDARNGYESRIGYFVHGNGEKAVTPEFRRFSQWPGWVVGYLKQRVVGEENGEGGKQILTYCTGGIRCEKATRWMQEVLHSPAPGPQPSSEKEKPIICTLKGGIAAYLSWMDKEILAGRKTATDSLFRGRNYVFDGRGSTGLNTETQPVAKCHDCGISCDRLGKCKSKGCHLDLVLCEDCEAKDVRCCRGCGELEEDAAGSNERLGKAREMCDCEKEREARLWGGESAQMPKIKGWKKGRRNEELRGGEMDIRVKSFG
jgi:predicted sulfurtransferase